MYFMRFALFLLFFSNVIFAQTEYPKDDFSPPLEIPMQLSGNFGELRPNHFHAGFDLKTNQREGLSVHAIGDGYVSRIKISTFGSGKTIYITHPNGYTSVYGHLQKTIEPLESFIKKNHYQERAFEMDLFLKPDEIVFKKGQQIAFSGNTGSSEGPHLHFEIRDTKTENIINPLFFGFDKNFVDTKKPVISSVYVYPLDFKTTVNHSKRPILLGLSLQKDGTYLAEKVVANGAIGFGIANYDFDNTSFNQNGVFKVQTFVNGFPNFGYQFDTCSYDEMRYINALLDYSLYKKAQTRVQKLFMKKTYALSIIKTDETNGIITVTPNLDINYRIEVSDFYGNKSVITVPITYDLLSTIIDTEPAKTNYFVKSSTDCNFEKDNMSVFFPSGTFYDDFDINFDVKNNTLFLHDDSVPAHTGFTISITDTKFDKKLRDKLFIGTIDSKKISFNRTYRKDTVFTTKTKTLGKFALVLDTISPKIKTLDIRKQKLLNQNSMQFTIEDQLSGIKSYNGYLNGKWILLEYDNKTKKLTHNFGDGVVAEGKNDLKVVVVDNAGNAATFETPFFRNTKNIKNPPLEN
jgi:Peptidase family M23